jgi:hypothetical protein
VLAEYSKGLQIQRLQSLNLSTEEEVDKNTKKEDSMATDQDHSKKGNTTQANNLDGIPNQWYTEWSYEAAQIS